MSISSAFRWLKPRSRVASPRRRLARPLCLETLEDRNLLSSGWVNTVPMSPSGPSSAPDVAVDPGGVGRAPAVYVTGGFTGSVDFHPGFADGKLTSAGGADIFLAKYGTDGTFQWVQQIGGASYDQPWSLAVDAAGNATVAGTVGGLVTVGLAAGLNTAGGGDVLVARFDPIGNLAWAKALGGTGYDEGLAVAADDAGVYVTGRFEGTASFGGVSLTSAGDFDMFVTRLHPATGATTYAVQGGGTTFDKGYGIDVDAGHNAYVGGTYSGQASFGTITLGGGSSVLAKVDPSGQFLWAQDGGGRVAVDRAGGTLYVYAADLGNVRKYTSDGQVVSNRVFSAAPSPNYVPTGTVGGAYPALDSSGNLYVGGSWFSNGGTQSRFPWVWVDTDPSPGGALVDGNFIAKLNAAGDFQGGWLTPGSNGGAARVAADGAGNVYTAGWFTGTASFDTGTQTVTKTSSGYSLYLVQIGQDQGGVFGQLYLDSNQNGARDSGETPLAARTVYADVNNDGVRNTGEPLAVTGPEGGYEINHLPAGTYKIRQELPTGCTSTVTPSPVTLAAGQFVSGFDFGSFNSTAVHTYTNNTPMSLVGTKKNPNPTSTITVTDNLTLNDLNVRVNITYPDDHLLTGAPWNLIAPDGAKIKLTYSAGSIDHQTVYISGANLTNTVFDDQASLALIQGTAPYTGSFRPFNSMYPLNGKSLNGTWKLQFPSLTTGTLNSWSLIATASPTTIGGSSGVAGPAGGAAAVPGVAGSQESFIQREAERLAIAGFLRGLHHHG